MKTGPIVIIEDDVDDQDILEEVMKELGVKNRLVWFKDSIAAYDYLKDTEDQPFLVLCDVNLPMQNGIDFKRQIDGNEYLRRKSIPFLFYSTSVSQQTVNEAYTQMTVQGFFQKADTYQQVKSNFKTILDYWNICKHPNT